MGRLKHKAPLVLLVLALLVGYLLFQAIPPKDPVRLDEDPRSWFEHNQALMIEVDHYQLALHAEGKWEVNAALDPLAFRMSSNLRQLVDEHFYHDGTWHIEENDVVLSSQDAYHTFHEARVFRGEEDLFVEFRTGMWERGTKLFVVPRD